MSQMTTTYLGELRTEGKHLKSGNTLVTDAPIDNNGKGEAYSPTDLVCAALSSCILTTMGIVANRDGIDMKGMTAEVTKIMAVSPRRIAEIVVNMKLPEEKVNRLSEKNKQVLKHSAHTCPVALSLHPDTKQTLLFNF
ncbi:MAG TPA: OsmC family protein [Cytophagaceae bacterium]|nr:OsmC family protein [Cytophagaceae bacterium]